MVYNLQNHLFLSSHTPLEQQTLINSASRTCHLYMYSFVYVLTLPIYGPWSLIGHDDGFCIQMVTNMSNPQGQVPTSTLSHSSYNLWSLCAQIFAPV